MTAIRAMLLRDMGGCISPVHAFIFLQGLETLSLRVERHVENALKVVQYLNNHPQVERVYHPSVSTDPSSRSCIKIFPERRRFHLHLRDRGRQGDKKFCDNLELFSLLANVADVKSLVIHPASTTHAQLSEEELNEQGIYSNTIRLSIGTENIDDIIEDHGRRFPVCLRRDHAFISSFLLWKSKTGNPTAFKAVGFFLSVPVIADSLICLPCAALAACFLR